jgi:hypothetical protein
MRKECHFSKKCIATGLIDGQRASFVTKHLPEL